MTKVVANFLVTLGLILLSFFSYHFIQRNNPNRLKINTQDIEILRYEDLKPVSIQINELDINLPVILTNYDGKNWNTTSEGVSYIGNNIYYGHNWGSILGKLPKAKIGQVIEVKLSDGSIQKYKITETYIVEPNNSNILEKADENTLVIYTCTGFLDSKRFIVSASLI